LTDATETLTTGEHERHLALSTLVQQGTYVWTTVVMLVVVTALARSLTLSELGVYGLTTSFAAYLLVAQGAVEAAAVRALAQALTREHRERVFSMAFTAYMSLGLAIGVVIAGGGNLLVAAFDINGSLVDQARAGFVLLGAITWFGWPLKTFTDVLRGSQLFVAAATAEAAAFGVYGTAVAVALVAGAPLWVLIGLGGAIPAFTGAASAVTVMRSPATRVRYHLGGWDAAEMRAFIGSSGMLFVTSLADLMIYSLDRLILGFFRPAATVGLYEGPVRVHNVVRQVQGVLSLTVLPAGSRYVAEGDDMRVRELIVRGTRYCLFVTLPLVVVFMALAKPLLETWLGPKFGAAATAMTVMVGYWLVTANTNVAGSMLIAVGRVRTMALYAWVTALANLALSLALTPWLGLNGVVLGTAIPAVVVFPWFVWLVQRWLPVTWRDFAREAWIPAYSVAAGLAAVLVGLRLALDPSSLPAVIGLCALGLLGGWAAVYAFCLRASERALIGDMARVVVARARRLRPAHRAA
jgi:O-antigen/teichoic acid export membrane protein